MPCSVLGFRDTVVAITHRFPLLYEGEIVNEQIHKVIVICIVILALKTVNQDVLIVAGGGTVVIIEEVNLQTKVQTTRRKQPFTNLGHRILSRGTRKIQSLKQV